MGSGQAVRQCPLEAPCGGSNPSSPAKRLFLITLLSMQFDDKPLREIDDTSGSAAEDRFEEIISRVKAANADIIKDESGPLYLDLGREEVEIGDQRIVEFNLNRMDFQIVRNAKTVRVVGEGHNKSVEPLSRPIIEIKLKRKPETSDQWVFLDLEEMF